MLFWQQRPALFSLLAALSRYSVLMIFIASPQVLQAMGECTEVRKLDLDFPEIKAGTICVGMGRQIEKIQQEYQSFQAVGERIQAVASDSSGASVMRGRVLAAEKRKDELQTERLQKNLIKLRKLIQLGRNARLRLEVQQSALQSARFMGSLSKRSQAEKIQMGIADLENTLLRASDMYLEYTRILERSE